MLITCTPFRVSFFGGGTDLPNFCEKEVGKVLSTTIAAHMYITIHQLSVLYPFKIRVSYSRTELAMEPEEIQHPVVRECLKMLKIKQPIEITSIADIPSQTGLGSSSSFTVGLLHALHAFQGELITPEQLAEEACRVEIELLGEPIGKQDQYAAAFGGLRKYTFLKGEGVIAHPIICRQETLIRFFDSLMMFYLGGTRAASEILREQNLRTDHNMNNLREMRDMCDRGEEILQGKPEDLPAFGALLDESWQIKRKLAPHISSPQIDQWYGRACEAGAIGGKLLGAGGTGFLLLYVEKENQSRVREAFDKLIEQPVTFESEGSRIAFIEESEFHHITPDSKNISH